MKGKKSSVTWKQQLRGSRGCWQLWVADFILLWTSLVISTPISIYFKKKKIQPPKVRGERISHLLFWTQMIPAEGGH